MMGLAGFFGLSTQMLGYYHAVAQGRFMPVPLNLNFKVGLLGLLLTFWSRFSATGPVTLTRVFVIHLSHNTESLKQPKTVPFHLFSSSKLAHSVIRRLTAT